jgi:hypothetical protein
VQTIAGAGTAVGLRIVRLRIDRREELLRILSYFDEA